MIGLNVLTGETGSGKSIIIEALGMVLGGRGTRDLISTGADRAILQAVFVLEDENDSIRSFLDEQGIPIDEDGLLIISREISINSPSISRINDKVVTLTILNKISHRLVDIFAQHEHQSLLNTSNHKTIIDSFGDHKHRNLLDEIASIYQGYKENRQLLSEMDIDVMERERLIDLYRFQIDEIDSLQLTPYDDEEIEDDYRKLSNVMEITQGLGQVVEYFSGDGYDTMSLLDSINKSIALLSNISEYDKDLLPLLDRLREANYELQDLNNEFKYYMDNIQLDEERLNILSERLDLVNRLKKKYGNNVQSILDYRDSTEEALDKLLNHENEIRVLREKLREQEEDLYGLSKKLSESRRSLALDLEEAITRELDELNMHNVRFKVDFKESPNLASDGIDKIEFLISTNLGEDLKPMSKIASGGEMSRIMLGFKSILAKYDGIPTLIFDEIDSGISGRTAQVVGEKIHKISKERQVISISHLPQIAAMADSQYSIYKEIKKGRVTTFIKKLDEEERVLELAKLLGGVDLTETTINHVKEMLQMTKKLKMENFNT
jgi:DNA repair protein RecN (Recombination protein N)